ncbi:hypothetical protein IAT38_000490 [Cryptococcus sp. DSM 104549]
MYDEPPPHPGAPPSTPLFASTQAPTPASPLLRLRITHITSTQSAPLPNYRQYYAPPRFATAIPPGNLPAQVPVIRIFGSTPSAQKVCANIHLCYPYFYVPYPMDSTDPLRPERVVKMCQRFAVSLNHAICLAMRQNPTSTSNAANFGGGVDPRHLHVVSVMLVKGTPFYGYHMGYSYFLKVSLANPARMYIALEQLRKPNVLGREWQPHEAHMNHVLQVMCDFDLYGCGWLDLAGGTFRDPLPPGDPFDSPSSTPAGGRLDILNSLTIPSHMIYPPGLSPPKDSYTALEIDILPHHILNRQRLTPRLLHHDLVELLHKPLDPNEKLVPAVAELWEDERRRRASKGLSVGSAGMMPESGGMDGRTMEELGYKVKKEGKEGEESGEENKNIGGDWKISEELWEMLEERMKDERKRRGGQLTFTRFSADAKSGKDGERRMYDRWVMTTFEAVSAHWPKQPKPPRSTQKSKKTLKSSQTHRHTSPSAGPSSPGGLPTSPTKRSSPARGVTFDGSADGPVRVKLEDDIEDFEEDVVAQEEEVEEANPFEIFAMTQASQHLPPNPELSRPAPLAAGPGPVEEDEYDQYFDDLDLDLDPDAEGGEGERRHAEEARLRAEQGNVIRATQMQAKRDEEDGDDEDGLYEDEELDELFRKTVAASLGVGSAPTTPSKKRGVNVSAGSSRTMAPGSTPTLRSGGSGISGGSASTGVLESRKRKRNQRMLDQAGLGDLSTIFDQSSITLSPSSTDNPYDDRDEPRTPTKAKTPVGEKATPTSLVRNLFAKNRRPSPFNSPSKRKAISSYDPSNVVVLPPLRKTPGKITSSPENEVGDVGKVKMEAAPGRAEEVGVLKVIGAEVEEASHDDTGLFFQPDQGAEARSPSPTPASGPTAVLSPTLISKRQASPTLHDLSATTVAFTTPSGDAESSARRKRVKLATPGSASQHRLLPSTSQVTPIRPSQITSGSSAPALALNAWQYHLPPPSASDVLSTMDELGIPALEELEPFYGNKVDVPPRPKLLAGRMFTIRGNGAEVLYDFECSVGSGVGARKGKGKAGAEWLKTGKEGRPLRWRYGWEYAVVPPGRKEVVQWCEKVDEEARIEAEKHAQTTSQLLHPTQKNKYGVKFSQKTKTRDSTEGHTMTVMTLETFALSRHQLLPDPEKDPVAAIFYCYQNMDDSLPDTTVFPGYHAGYVVVGAHANPARLRLDGIPCHVVDNELDLINWVIDTVKDWDPDVLAGWEMHNSSWGYLASRATEEFSMDIMDQLSRVMAGPTGPRNDGYSAHHSSTFKVVGRHILNVWRICRGEINLTQYSFENVVFHLLHQRIPHYSHAGLTALWKSKTPEHVYRVLKYFFQRAVMCMEVIDQAEIITKNAEFARVFGVDFASVMTRGSQFKVESFMFRIAKPESFVLVTPSKQQVGLQNAPFATPLIAEPESKYYTHPIVVLDFQSLYPSIMIAYNICYSTCLGRVEKFKGANKFGFTELKVATGLLELLMDYLTVTPNGMIFVKPAVRKSLLAKMLGEILDTRVMVKHAMKGARGDKSLTAMLNARQLGLKLMANVTYGYTSATYSGRMPCIEVADSIVQTGRETLEKAQELIHSRADWGARVVYGDTDSLFIALPGRTKDQAFKIGHDIADAVTACNPKPVKLKFEKVYMGSVLMAKKRYVGFKYEHPDDTEPVFDAKGIETIRRDGFPAQQKIEEVCLKLLFRTQDLSQVKEFCQQEWTKILQGRVSIQDFIVAKEVRLGTYSEKGVPPPGAAVAYRRILKDPRDEPQYAERVPYLISNADGRRLIDRARMPEEMLASRSLGIDAEYYIKNLLIPPLSRIFNLVGADVEGWFDSMPRKKRVGKYESAVVATGTSTRGTGTGRGGRGRGRGRKGKANASGNRIDSHFRSSHCILCGLESSETLCQDCRSDPSTASHALLSRQHLAQEKLVSFQKICASCSSAPVVEKIMCDSIDCPITYARVGALREVEDLEEVGGLLEELNLSEDNEGWGAGFDESSAT